MSLTAFRLAAPNARRTYPSAGSAEPKHPEGEGTRLERSRKETVAEAIPLEPHWQASIESATD